ncbi:hypothetical protein [Bradyrhizobium erythrophlei]|uniref:hypothetical protein n=1 Tax=Bradyrhizobium erythrophlei TaxID=1437360 RepID=UPI0015C580D3|nr:hypothetical protein [Bradyrhizobium erythrophlei]
MMMMMMMMFSGFDDTGSPDGCGHCRNDSERNRETCSHYLPQQLTIASQPAMATISSLLIPSSLISMNHFYTASANRKAVHRQPNPVMADDLHRRRFRVFL